MSLSLLSLPVRPDPLDRLPGSSTDDPFTPLAAGWLVGHPKNTPTAYRRDLEAWSKWCSRLDVHPLAAERHHVDLWAPRDDRASTPHRPTGRAGDGWTRSRLVRVSSSSVIAPSQRHTM